MLLCKKVSLCKSSLKIRMGCSHDLLSVLQRGWLVPGTSVGRNINPACLFERPPWSEKHQDSGSLTWLSPEVRKTLCVREMALRARRRREMTLCVPVEREISGFRFAYVALAVGAS